MFRSFVLLLVFASFFIACKKGGPEEKDLEIKLNPDGLKYVQLRAGQYFIYRDSATGNTDSVIVTVSDMIKEPWTATSGKPATRERFRLQMIADRPGFDSTWVDGTAQSLENSNDFFLSGFPLVYFGYPCSPCVGGFKLSSMSVEGRSYNDVMVSVNDFGGGTVYTYYWAPSVGLIKAAIQITSPANRSVYTLLRNN